MRKLHLWMSALLMIFVITANGQSTSSRDYKRICVSDFQVEKASLKNFKTSGEYILRTVFKNPISQAKILDLESKGIQVLKGYGKKEYLISTPERITAAELSEAGISEIKVGSGKEKLSKEFDQGYIPSWAEANAGNAKITIAFLNKTTNQEIANIAEQFELKILNRENPVANLTDAIINPQQIDELAKHPLVTRIEYIQEPDQILNFENRSIQRVNTIQSYIPGELNLEGEGVCIGVGDGGALGDHIDFEGRVINKANGTYASFGAHADHVSGIIGGAGGINPWHHGMAPKSTIITQKTSLIYYYAPDYYTEHGMVLTNNSYGTSSNCELNGSYNTTSSILDKQLNDYPDLLHVFAAGNSGGNNCDGYPEGYRTVLRFYQASKNILTVGNVEEDKVINTNSSRGPVMDGRIKPEIVGVGTSVISTGNNYNYYSGSGTSMAAPSVTGVLGLLYERYRDLNNGINPKSALIKAIACNTAEDLGNPGPDFTYGYGLINATAAAKTISENNFFAGDVADGETQSFQVNVPEGAARLKVMLYWHDVEGDPNSNVALINDLDIKMTKNGQTYLPWVLDHSPANVENEAIRAEDHLNNIEQITLENPAAGNYDIDVTGFDIPLGSQDYFIAYEIVEDEVELTFPTGGEVLEPGSALEIRWNIDNSNTSDFKIELSENGGSTWSLIADNIPSSERSIDWTSPTTISETAKIRVSTISTGLTDESDANFSVIPCPANLAAVPSCARTVDLSWDTVPDAAAYEVFMFQAGEFVSLGTTVEDSFKVMEQMDIGTMYWFSIKTILPSGLVSERAIAVPAIPDSNDPCDWENDALLFSPGMISGRKNTSLELSEDYTLEMKVLNVGTNQINLFTIHYSINNQPTVSETFFSSIPSGDSTEVTFTEGINLAGIGNYTISAWIEVPGDQNPNNNSMATTDLALHVDNPRLVLPFEESFISNSYKLSGYHFAIPDYDFVDVNTGSLGEFELLKYGVDKVMSLSPTQSWVENETFAEAVFTINLENYFRSNDPVVFSLKYAGHSAYAPAGSPTGNRIEVRGTDQDEWITIYNMYYSKDWNQISGIDISHVIEEAGQDLSSSSQIRIVQDDFYGIFIDNFLLTTASRLPVDISSFELIRTSDADTRVAWTTESEYNNDRFEVQVATNNTDFVTIGTVRGKGTSTTTENYDYVDVTPNKTGIRYYRLKQVDFDGTATYTNIKSLMFGESVAKVMVYPNPIISRFHLHYEAEQEEKVDIQLVNLSGKVLLRQPLHVSEGNHEYLFELDEDLEAGMYMLQLTHSNNRITTIPISKIRG